MDFAIFELSIEFQNFPRSVQTIKLTSVKYNGVYEHKRPGWWRWTADRQRPAMPPEADQ